MEGKMYSLAALLVLSCAAAVVIVGVAADTGKICNMSRDGLMACQPAISGPSTSQKPSPNPTDTCCAALAHADLNCLCGYKNSGLLPYLGINPDLAMQLPAKCNIPPPTKC